MNEEIKSLSADQEMLSAITEAAERGLGSDQEALR